MWKSRLVAKERKSQAFSSGGGGKRSDEHNKTFAFPSFLLPFCVASSDGPIQKFRGEIVVGRNEMEESHLFHGTRQQPTSASRPGHTGQPPLALDRRWARKGDYIPRESRRDGTRNKDRF